MKLLNIFLEALKKKTAAQPQAKVDVADKPTFGFDFNQPTSKGSLTKTEPKNIEPKPSRKVASASDTWNKMGNIKLDQDKLNQMQLMDINPDEVDMDDEISDQEAAERADVDTEFKPAEIMSTPYGEPKPTTPEMLPAVISKALVKSGMDVANIEPEWHMVKHLPGYLSKPIRAMGRQVFSPFTKTPIEDIQVLADIGGGPNTEAELNLITKYVSSHGKRNDAMELAFHKVIPGYQADVVIYDCDGCTFFLVKDFAGQYIYSWPESDSKQVFDNPVDKRLGRERKVPRLQ